MVLDQISCYKNLHAQRLYKGDPLTPEEREAYEEDLIAFCDRELDLLGDIKGLDVLYAGGSSLLWVEGLSQRIGEAGTLTVLDADSERVGNSRKLLGDADLAAPVRLVAGDAFEPPFSPEVFDLVYSTGLFHELDVRKRPVEAALVALASVVRPSGRVATSDFVGDRTAVQLEDEELQGELAYEASGAMFYGVRPSGRLVALHEALLDEVRWRVSPPYPIRHLDKLVLAEEEPEKLRALPGEETRRLLRERREALHKRIRYEGYTRPATLYVEGRVGR